LFCFFIRRATFPRAILTVFVVVNGSVAPNFLSALIQHFRLLQRQWAK
jgi:hypothetical protein